MGIFNAIDDRELTREVLWEHGYVLLQNFKPGPTTNYIIFRKQIFHFDEISDQKIGRGMVYSYLDIFMFLDPDQKYKCSARLGYLTLHSDHRFIMGGYINTESDLLYEELWAKTTSVAINNDRASGTFNYQKYERTGRTRHI